MALRRILHTSIIAALLLSALLVLPGAAKAGDSRKPAADDMSTRSMIVSCDPPWAYRGQTLDLSIGGVGTSFVQDYTSPQFYLTDGTWDHTITGNGTTVLSGTEVISSVTVTPASPLGYRDVTLRTG